MQKLKRLFCSRDFLVFLAIGAINTLNGTLFSYLYSLLFDANIAFILGYLSSLLIGYILNSIFTFKEKLSFIRLFKTAVSYIPNFIIQNLVVLLIYNVLGLHRLIAYALAALIGLPLTFLLMKFFAFAKPKIIPKGEQK